VVVFLDLQQGFEEAQPFVETGLMGVETAGEVEGTTEPGLPRLLIRTGRVSAAVE
jgi:hypothetical protein